MKKSFRCCHFDTGHFHQQVLFAILWMLKKKPIQMMFTIQKYQINVLHTRRKLHSFYFVATIDFSVFFKGKRFI